MFLTHMWNFNSRILFCYWSIIALRFYVRFWCTTKWISYIGTYIPSRLNLPSTPLNPPRLVITEYLAKLPVLFSSFTLATLYMVVYICQPYSPIHLTLPFLPYLHISILYICNSFPALQTSSSVPFFYIPYICINIWYLNSRIVNLEEKIWQN